MGRARFAHRRSIPRSRVPLHRRVLLDPAALRYWAVVVVLALLVGTGVSHVLARARSAERRWGRSRPVLVATEAVATGDDLAAKVAVRSWPAALVSAAWPTSVPKDARSAGPLAPGAPVTNASVAGTGSAGADGDRRQVAIPVGQARLSLRRGDRVDVWATSDPSLAKGELATRRVATGAVVTSSGSRAVVVAVRPAEVPDVAEAATVATVTLVSLG